MPERLSLDVTYKGVVYPRECDHMGHMNVSAYVAKFDQASWQLFAACGIDRTYLETNKAVMAGVHQVIDYFRECRPGDVLSITSRVLDVGERKLRWLHEMYDDATQQRVATCELTAVHIDAGSRRPKPFPDGIRAGAAALVDAHRGT